MLYGKLQIATDPEQFDLAAEKRLDHQLAFVDKTLSNIEQLLQNHTPPSISLVFPLSFTTVEERVITAMDAHELLT
jgi:hypothetical protein